MKSNVKILGVTFLMAIYCFTVFALANLRTNSGYINHQDSEQISAVHSSLYHHTTQSESSITSITIPAVLDFKKSIDELWAMRNATDQIIETEFTQYSTYASNFLTQYRKADLIFPFQYFW